MLYLLSTLAFAKRHIEVEVQLPPGEPRTHNLYRSSTELWRVRNGRVLGSFQSSSEDLACNIDGRWLTATVELKGNEFPAHFPHPMRCENDDLIVDVLVVQSPAPWEATLVDNSVVLPRTRGKVQRAAVVVPYQGLEAGRVTADVRGVWCDVEEQGEETTLNVRVSPIVLAEEATCELPTETGGSMPVQIELPKGS